MAITIKNRKQSTVNPSSSLTGLTSATAGSILACFVSTTGTIAPTMSDNLGSTGWTVNATSAVWTTNSAWLATKTAVGGETEIKATPAEGKAIQGLSYFELAGAATPASFDVVAHTDNAKATTVSSPSYTTTDASDVILAGVGSVANLGVATAWTGTGPMENTNTASTRMLAGSYIPGSTVTAAVFTANWTTSQNIGMLVVSLKATRIEVAVTGGGQTSHSPAAFVSVHGGGEVKRTTHIGGENRIAVTGGGKTSHAQAAFIAVHGGGSVARTTERAPDPGMPKIVQRGKSGAAGVSSLALAQAATSGTLLIAFVEIGEVSGPAITDNLGATWTAHPTVAVFQSGGASLTMYYKRAAGGETEIKASASSGIAYYEVEKLSEVTDVIAHVDSQKSTSSSFTGFSTSNGRDLILGAWGMASSSGNVAPWTGTGPLTFISTTSTRVVSGALVPETTLTGATFTAAWTNNTNNGGIVVAFLSAGVIKVAGGGNTGRTSFVQPGTSTHKASTQGKVTETSEVLLGTPLISVHGGGGVSRRGSTATHITHGGGSVRRTSSAIIGSVTRRIHGGGAALVVSYYTPGVISHRVTGGGIASITKGNAVHVTGGGRTSHDRFTGSPVFPSNAPLAGRAAGVHTGRVEALTR